MGTFCLQTENVSNQTQQGKQETINLLLELKGHGAFATPIVQAIIGEQVATTSQDRVQISLLLEFKGDGELEESLNTGSERAKTSKNQNSCSLKFSSC